MKNAGTIPQRGRLLHCPTGSLPCSTLMTCWSMPPISKKACSSAPRSVTSCSVKSSSWATWWGLRASPQIQPNLLVHATHFQQALDNLYQVFLAIRGAGLQLSPPQTSCGMKSSSWAMWWGLRASPGTLCKTLPPSPARFIASLTRVESSTGMKNVQLPSPNSALPQCPYAGPP